jgi:hypothetical protein
VAFATGIYWVLIATGVVEGAARYVVGERLDNSGMRWIEERAEAVLLLRCIEVSGSRTERRTPCNCEAL